MNNFFFFFFEVMTILMVENPTLEYDLVYMPLAYTVHFIYIHVDAGIELIVYVLVRAQKFEAFERMQKNRK